MSYDSAAVELLPVEPEEELLQKSELTSPGTDEFVRGDDNQKKGGQSDQTRNEDGVMSGDQKHGVLDGAHRAGVRSKRHTENKYAEPHQKTAPSGIDFLPAQQHEGYRQQYKPEEELDGDLEPVLRLLLVVLHERLPDAPGRFGRGETELVQRDRGGLRRVKKKLTIAQRSLAKAMNRLKKARGKKLSIPCADALSADVGDRSTRIVALADKGNGGSQLAACTEALATGEVASLQTLGPSLCGKR